MLLSSLSAALISLPLVLGPQKLPAFLIAVFALMGALIGYRKRRSVLFFYVCLVTILALSTLISFKIDSQQIFAAG